MSAGPVRASGYAPALDGVRAFAVVAVILYHAGAGWLPGGFLGVDVFFVVSGYLVTALLQRERDRTGRVRLGNFWLRRIRRLMPALVLMLVVVCALVFALQHDLNAGLRSQTVGAATYLTNWVQVGTGASYVEHSQPSVLTHLWSLAVEEQFYLIWPPILVLLLAQVRRRRRRAALVLVAAAASALAMALLFRVGGDPTRVYVGTDTHGFSLLLGAALALARTNSLISPVKRMPMAMPTGTARWLGTVGLVTVVLGMVQLDDTGSATYRGGILLSALGATALVAAATRGGDLLERPFTVRPIRWLGLRSYSLYLWHWPLLVIAARVLPPTLPAGVVASLAVASAIVCAEISWRLVEDPIRRLGTIGYFRHLRQLLLDRRAAPRGRRRLGWGLTAAFGISVLTAACGVVEAPTRTALETQLEAGQAALAEAGRVAATVPPGPTASARETESDKQPEVLAGPGSTGQQGATGQSGSVGQQSEAGEPNQSLGSGSGDSLNGSAPATGSNQIGNTALPGDDAVVGTDPAPVPGGDPRPGGPAATAAGVEPSAQMNSGAADRHPKPTGDPAVVQAPVTGDRVTAVGDSVMLAAAPALLAALPRIDIDAVVSRQVWELPDWLAAKRQVRPVLVIGLGTNGSETADQLRDALTPADPDQRVVLVTTFVDQPWQDEMNAAIAEVARTRPHTCIADWHAAIDAHQDLLGPDRVHPGNSGGQLYAATVNEAVQRCR